MPLKGLAHAFSARLLRGVCGIVGALTVFDDLATFLGQTLPLPLPTSGSVRSAGKGGCRVAEDGAQAWRGVEGRQDVTAPHCAVRG
ncbi:hypothetical protein FM076_14090 [Streptomyces albus subsp. chlorinus]|nr:hypothetical protein [Streptomyces albus subsp. chlorinus]